MCSRARARARARLFPLLLSDVRCAWQLREHCAAVEKRETERSAQEAAEHAAEQATLGELKDQQKRDLDAVLGFDKEGLPMNKEERTKLLPELRLKYVPAIPETPDGLRSPRGRASSSARDMTQQ